MEYANTKAFLQAQIETHTDETKCKVLPLPCGAGKSSFIRGLVTAKHSRGMVVVTDKISSAQNYLKVYDDDKGEYVKIKSNRVVLLTHENIAESLPMVNYKPVVIMTFKRYFSMELDEIKALSTYQYGKRDLVIFDEQPTINDTIVVGLHTLTDVFADLYNAITDAANQDDKQWIVGQVEKFIDRYKNMLDRFESYSNYAEFYFYFRDEIKTISDDEQRFNSIIKRYKAEISKNNFDTIPTIRNIQYMLEHGAFFRCQKVGAGAGEYIKDFSFRVDNTDKLTNIGMKTFIFDGTASYTTDYDKSCFEIVQDCDTFRRSYECLTIDIVNANTSKYALTKKASKDAVIQAIIDEIKANNPKDAIVFTYKTIERQFAEYVKNTAHFGDIKGRNDLKANRYYQIGLNRLPTHIYLLMLSTSEEHGFKQEYQHYFSLEPQEQIEIFHKKMQSKSLDSDIKYVSYRELLADIEQNLMRSTLREIANNEPVQYTLYFDSGEMYELYEALQFRFGCMGASVNIQPTPEAIVAEKIKTRKPPKGKEKTNAQKIIDYIQALDSGVVFKVSDMIKAIGISNSQLKDAKKRNQALTKMLNQMQTEVKGYYKKAD